MTFKGSSKYHGRSNLKITEDTGNGDDLEIDEFTDVVKADTNDSTLTVTLPSAAEKVGNKVTVVDVGGNAGSNAITITSSGSDININGSDQNLTIGTNYAKMELVYTGDGWFATTTAP